MMALYHWALGGGGVLGSTYGLPIFDCFANILTFCARWVVKLKKYWGQTAWP